MKVLLLFLLALIPLSLSDRPPRPNPNPECNGSGPLDYALLPWEDDHAEFRDERMAYRKANIHFGDISALTDFPDFARNISSSQGPRGSLITNFEVSRILLEITEAGALLGDGYESILSSGNTLQTLEAYADLYNEYPFQPIGLYEWDTDVFYENLHMTYFPYYIEKVKTLPQALAFGRVPGVNLALEQRNGNLYMIDYAAALGPMQEKEPGIYGKAEAVLFRGRNGNTEGPGVKVLAIRVAGINYYPSSTDPKWLLAKMFALAGESYGTAGHHFFLTHLVQTPMRIALERNLHDNSPLYVFLSPYLRDVLALPTLGFPSIFSTNTNWDNYTAFGGQGVHTYLNYVWGLKTFGERHFLQDLEDRGVADLNGYTFAEVGYKYYEAFHRLASAFVNKYYPTNDILQADYEAQGFLDDMRTYGQIPGLPQQWTRKFLKEFLADVFIKVSMVHHVTNFKTMYHYQQLLPANPMALYLGFNATSYPTSFDDITRWMPNLQKAALQVQFAATFTNRQLTLPETLLFYSWVPKGLKMKTASNRLERDMLNIHYELGCDDEEFLDSQIVSKKFYCPRNLAFTGKV